MFRELVRKKQQLSQEECISILKAEPRGVLSVLGDDGYPYGMPLNHYYCEEDGKIYFHSGKTGHKVDAMLRDPKASFCVCDPGVREENSWALIFRSVIVFGRAREVSDPAELMDAMKAFAGKYSPKESEDSFRIEMKVSKAPLCVLAIDIEHKTGKEAVELVNKG